MKRIIGHTCATSAKVVFYSLGHTTIPTSIVNIIVVGTYLNVGGGLPLDHRIKRIGPVN
jgi:hypothetical protein